MNQPWIEYLSHEGAEITDNSARFPTLQDDPDSCAVVPLVHLAQITSHGEDSTPFLHNLLSNDVQKLAKDTAQWTSLSTPKGRMLASMLLFRDTDGHGMVLSADIAAAIQKRLSMYLLRSKARLTAMEDALIGVTGPDAAGILTAAGIEAPHDRMRQTIAPGLRCIRIDSADFILIAVPETAPGIWQRLREAGARPAGTDRWQLAMIRAGVPLITAATQEEFVAQMLNFELIDGVSFSKGCYPGQEIVARTQYLGKLKKRMYRVHSAEKLLPQVGDNIYTPKFGTQSAGKIVNVAPTPEGGFEALAVLQANCAETGEAHLDGPEGAPLEFLPLPYNVE